MRWVQSAKAAVQKVSGSSHLLYTEAARHRPALLGHAGENLRRKSMMRRTCHLSRRALSVSTRRPSNDILRSSIQAMKTTSTYTSSHSEPMMRGAKKCNFLFHDIVALFCNPCITHSHRRWHWPYSRWKHEPVFASILQSLSACQDMMIGYQQEAESATAAGWLPLLGWK